MNQARLVLSSITFWLAAGGSGYGVETPDGKNKSLEVSPSASEMKRPTNCLEYLANPETGRIAFHKSKDKLYVTARKNSGGTKDEAYLYEVNLVKDHAKRILSLPGGDQRAIVSNGSLNGLTVMDFGYESSHCGEGFTSGFSVQWELRQRVIKSYRPSDYRLVTSNEGVLIADMRERILNMIDLDSAQRRLLHRFGKDVTPLYLHTNPIRFYGIDHVSGELFKMESGAKAGTERLKIPSGARIVQQGEKFALLEKTSQESKVSLQVPRSWGGSETLSRTFPVSLPEKVASNGAKFDFNFTTHALLVTDNAAQSAWSLGVSSSLLKTRYLYPNLENDTFVKLEAPDGLVIRFAQLMPDGKAVIALLGQTQVNDVRSVRLYDIVSQSWQKEIVLLQGGELGKAPAPQERGKSK